MTIAVIVILVLAALLVLYGIVTYNRLVRLRTQSEEGFSDIDVQLKRRHDLIPNLVETVKGYAAHERATLENVTAARSNAVAARGPEQRAQAENALTGALRQLFAVAEAYPDLKASQNFIELQDEITDTEDKIQAARRFYNMTVRDLNVKIDQFPSSVVAGVGNFDKREFFELDEPADREVPVVSFGTAGAPASPPAGPPS
jgi:LemA protein